MQKSPREKKKWTQLNEARAMITFWMNIRTINFAIVQMHQVEDLSILVCCFFCKEEKGRLIHSLTVCRFGMGGIFTTNAYAEHKTFGYHKTVCGAQPVPNLIRENLA